MHGTDRRHLRRRQVLAALLASATIAFPATLTAVAGDHSTAGLPPPTPVAPHGSLSPFVTRLHTPTDDALPPHIAAPSAILADLDTGQVLFARDPDRERPIASVTKIMTALIVLRRTKPSDIVTVSSDAAAPHSSLGLSELGLEAGEKISVGDLTWGLLVQSANDAAIALAEHVGGTVGRFVKMMDAEALRLGLHHTRFRSPNGLDDRGYSSARDLVTITRAAFAQSDRFATIVSTKFRTIASGEGPDREIQNRNVLLWLYPGATGVKTGYTSKARFCVVATASRQGRNLIAVVLGDPGEPFSDAAALLNYGFDGFTEHRFVTAGEPLGDVAVRGGTVRVASGGGLTALVATRSIDRSERALVIDPRAAFPPAPGEQVGVLRVTVPGRVLGSVPLVVTDVPGPPPVDDEPWWRRAAGSVAGALAGAMSAVLG